MANLQDFKDDLAKDLYGETTSEAQVKGLCIQCKQDAIENCYSDAGKREYKISGLCEKCFDEICGEM